MDRRSFCGLLGGLVLPGMMGCRKPQSVAAEPGSRLLGERVAAAVNGERVLQLARKQVEFGPRPAGSEALGACRDWLEEELQAQGWQVVRQSFQAQTPQGPKTMVNLRARFGAGAQNWQALVGVVYAAHYDTKWYDDLIFVGANDGASAVAVLLECARVMAQDPLGRELAGSLELVFFDGEEGIERIDAPTLAGLEPPLAGDGLWGSRYYAGQVRRGEIPPPAAIVVWDIVGDGREPLQIEGDSPDALKLGLQRAAQAATGRPLEYTATMILDDHIPFRLLQVPATVVMQANLLRNNRYWHTANDTLEVLDAEALARCTRIALHFLTRNSLPPR